MYEKYMNLFCDIYNSIVESFIIQNEDGVYLICIHMHEQRRFDSLIFWIIFCHHLSDIHVIQGGGYIFVTVCVCVC